MKISRLSPQLGLGLVELMVALVVSTFLLGGLIQIFIASKMSYRMLDGYSRLQENGRFAVDVLSKNIRLAGYRSDVSSNEETVFPITTNGIIYGSDGQVIIGSDGAVGSSDSITFRHQGSEDGLIEDCLGGDVDEGDTVSITFSHDPVDNELQCDVDGGTPQPLVDGVENMQILYGIDTSVPQDRFANVFLPAGPGLSWNNVVSVRIALLMNTVGSVSTQDDSKSYTLLSGVNGVNVAAATDHFRRHRFVTTINLRNRVRLQ